MQAGYPLAQTQSDLTPLQVKFLNQALLMMQQPGQDIENPVPAAAARDSDLRSMVAARRRG